MYLKYSQINGRDTNISEINNKCKIIHSRIKYFKTLTKKRTNYKHSRINARVNNRTNVRILNIRERKFIRE